MIKNLVAALAVLVALAACGAGGHATRGSGRSAPAKRIVSLIPSLTQDLCEIGAGKLVVGVSAYSDRIPCVRGVPVVAGFSSVDAERIVRLHPDLVVGIPSQQRTTESLRRAGIATKFFSDDTYEDIFRDIYGLGVATGRVGQANALIARLHLQTKTLQASRRFKRRPSIFVALGTGPIWTVGPDSYLSQIVALAGGRNAVTSLGSAYAQYSAEALLALQPDAIVTDRFTHLDSALGREPWRSLRAVRDHHVFVAPDNFERPGPYYNEGLHWLIERLRPLAS